MRGHALKSDVEFSPSFKASDVDKSLGSDSCNNPRQTITTTISSYLISLPLPSRSQVGQKELDFRPLGKLRVSPKGLEKATDTQMSVQDTHVSSVTP